MSDRNFLSLATDHAERQLKGGRTASLFGAEGSFCLRREGGEAQYLRLRRWMLNQLLGSLAAAILAVASVGLGVWGAPLGQAAPMYFYIAGGAMALVAFWLLFRAAEFDRWLKSHAPEVVQDLAAISSGPAVRVSIEDPETFDQFKLLADDCGFLVFMPEARMILIEGLRYRQLVRAEDLVDSYGQQAASVKSIGFEYLVGLPDRNRVVAKISLSSAKQEEALRAGLAECLTPIEDDAGDAVVDGLESAGDQIDP